jgi:hypothetical protein
MANRSTGFNATASTDTAKTSQGAVSVGTSSGVLVPANGDRVELTICNDHATQVVYLSLGGTAVANQGIRLGPGQFYTTNAYTGAVSAIATGAATGVTFAEV